MTFVQSFMKATGAGWQNEQVHLALKFLETEKLNWGYPMPYSLDVAIKDFSLKRISIQWTQDC